MNIVMLHDWVCAVLVTVRNLVLVMLFFFSGGAKIFDSDGKNEIGHVTSGCPSPSLRVNVSMGYVQTPFSKTDTPVKIQVRNKFVEANVTKMPFVPANYFFGKKS